MKRSAGLLFLGLVLSTTAAGAEAAGCGVSKGLYDGWLALAKLPTTRAVLKNVFVAGKSAATPDPAKQQAIGQEYQAFFQCLSDTAVPKDEHATQSYCREAGVDRLALLICQTAVYLKNGRTGSSEFVDAFPAGKRGAEMIWDLNDIAGVGPKMVPAAAMFLPNGPAFKLIDELFLLVLDGREAAAAKYFNLWVYSSGPGSQHMDEQIKILLRESPSVVVKRWAVLRQHQPRLKKLLSEMSATLPDAELRKMRRGMAGFCSKDNLDCPEILKIFGHPD